MIKAVIFDMDGVIVESEYRNYIAKLNILKPYGVTFDYDYYAQFPGMSNLVVCKKIINDFNIDASAKHLDEVDVIERKRLIDEQGHIAVDGAIALVKRLSKKYTLALASGSPPDIIESTLTAFGIRENFKFTISGENVEHCKPAPDVFLAAAKGIGVAPEFCAVIEDSHNGVLAAKSAGMYCIGFVNKNSGNQDLSPADEIVSNHSENRL